MNKLLKISLSFLLLTQSVIAQVPKKIIVEHFTNTKCGICASRNPGFYANISSQPGIMHLAVHPSSPYPTCVLSQHNPSENDSRTNFYGIFGGTPRLVIQGSVIATNVNYGSSSIFTPFLGKTTPASIRIMQTNYGNDSISSVIVVKTEAAHTLGSLQLFIALAEDTIFYTGSNGEPRHFDVFRKSLGGTSGVPVNLPSTVGDSVVFRFSSAINQEWLLPRIFTLAILQESITKEVVQSEALDVNSVVTADFPTGFNNSTDNNSTINAFSTSEKQISVIQAANSTFTLYDITGKAVKSERIDGNAKIINASELVSGIYIYALRSKDNILKTGKLLIN